MLFLTSDQQTVINKQITSNLQMGAHYRKRVKERC